jgi:WD repeat-containing protein 26
MGFASKQLARNLLTLSTVTTFDDATATMLPRSFSSTTIALTTAVNSLWFASLVFGIANAVNPLLGSSP